MVGRLFDLSLLEELVGEELPLNDALHELQRLSFIVPDRHRPQRRYRFKHVLIQEALYRTILTQERTRLHRLAAESLERRAAGTQEDALGLARHWAAAGVPAKAIGYYQRGAKLALDVFANEEAVEALTRALDLVAPDSGKLVARRARARSQNDHRCAARRVGGYGTPAVGEHYARATELCARLGSPVSPPVLRGMAINALARLNLAQAAEHGLALLEAAALDRDQMLMVEAQYVLGVTSFWTGDFAASRHQLEDAIAQYSADRHKAHITLYSQDPKVVCLAGSLSRSGSSATPTRQQARGTPP